ncbi:hypothetical protein CEUSTIGMA_g5916.t1 [Chlamydomonas eustigma]|uniref:RING-type domain-containing protein n=1 Tax=Chlamydomonas eustigma TaxID=1157962 RepID=A0A250X5V5_9CHLO|nr:hypothetical protein CEUSTIGMA_g5916.t1 [Chlamydomonas eustigma]|eukprot:GAX78477.1 hypothetical protein CEUSTIGMA_g5916.t1 [Chlamydomonas eustigma]
MEILQRSKELGGHIACVYATTEQDDEQAVCEVQLQPCGLFCNEMLTAIARLAKNDKFQFTIKLVHLSMDKSLKQDQGEAAAHGCKHHTEPMSVCQSPSVVIAVHVLVPSNVLVHGFKPRSGSGPSAALVLNAIIRDLHAHGQLLHAHGQLLGTSPPHNGDGCNIPQSDQPCSSTRETEPFNVVTYVAEYEKGWLTERRDVHSYSLSACFKDLPSCKGEPDPPPLLKHNHQDCTTSMHALDKECLRLICSSLSPQSLACVSCCCKFFQDMGTGTIPELRLSLYPHQRTALKWMQEKENKPADSTAPHPFIKEMIIGDYGIPVYVNLASGEVLIDPPQPLKVTRGGFFCDEPGLGKTITALSLILKTKDCLPKPSEGIPVEWTTDARGRKNGFYSVTSAAAASRAQVPMNSPACNTASKACRSNGGDAGSTRRNQKQGAPLNQNAWGGSTSAADTNCQQYLTTPQLVSSPTAVTAVALNTTATTTTAGTDCSLLVPAHQALAAAATTTAGTDCSLLMPAHQALATATTTTAGTECSLLVPAHQALAAAAGPIPPHLEDKWVQCDSCHKWRELPRDHKLDLSASWFCHLHPDEAWRSCKVPEQYVVPEGLSLLTCPGYVLPGDTMGSSANVEHFQSLLRRMSDPTPREASNVLTWLAKSADCSKLRTAGGLYVPLHHRSNCPYAELFRAFEFKRLLHDHPSHVSEVNDTVKNKRGSAGRGGRGGGKSSHGFVAMGYRHGGLQQHVKRQRSSEEITERRGTARATRGRRETRHDSDLEGSGDNSEMSEGSDIRSEGDEESSDLDDDSSYNKKRDGRSRKTFNGSQSQSTNSRRGRGAAGKKSAGGRPSFAFVGNAASGGGGSTSKLLQVNGRKMSQHTWVQRDEVMGLVFDQEALKLALDHVMMLDRNGGVLGSSSRVVGGGTQCWQDYDRVYLSRATLVVVPAVLIGHWQQQIQRHVIAGALAVRVLSNDNSSEAQLLPKDLAFDSDIVLTTFNRLSSEWESKLEAGLRGSSGSSKTAAGRKLLSQVHWKRIILDEGHQLGASLTQTNKLLTAIALKADCRWVMTGTPTPSTQASDISHFQPLLAFLRHEPYGSNPRTTWDLAVRLPFESKRPEGRRRLLDVLKGCMIRAIKSDLVILPKLIHRTTLLDFAPGHASSYNELVEVVRRNLVLADWCDENHRESLLNKKQNKWAKEMLDNVRKACCVAGASDLVVKEEDLLECLELISAYLGMHSPQEEWKAYMAEQKLKWELSQRGSVGLEAYVPAAPAPADMAAGSSDYIQGKNVGVFSEASAERQNVNDTPSVAGYDSDVEVVGETQFQAAGSCSAAKGIGTATRLINIPGPPWLPPGSKHPLVSVEESLRRGCNCQVCSSFTKLPVVTPCGHLACLDCTALHRKRCPLPSCRRPYLMQSVKDPGRQATNSNPQWAVPLHLIEWQPVYHQLGAQGVAGGEWSVKWEVTQSSKCLHLLRRLFEIGAARKQAELIRSSVVLRDHVDSEGNNKGHSTKSVSWVGMANVSNKGDVTDAITRRRQPAEHNAMDALTTMDAQQANDKNYNSMTRTSGDTFGNLSCSCQGILKSYGHPLSSCHGRPPVTKVLIFSQFWIHLKLIAAHLKAYGVGFLELKRGMKHLEQQDAVLQFSLSKNIGVLLMDVVGAVGLDLSFVSHVFLMEPVADKSMEEQVISRAHRMGAKQSVHVEVLAMRDTMEHDMLRLAAMQSDGASGDCTAGITNNLMTMGNALNSSVNKEASVCNGASRDLPLESYSVAGCLAERSVSSTQSPSLDILADQSYYNNNQTPTFAHTSGPSGRDWDESHDASTMEPSSTSRTTEAEDVAAEKAVRGLAAEAAISSFTRESSAVAAAAEKARNERHYLFLKLRKVAISKLPHWQDLDIDLTNDGLKNRLGAGNGIAYGNSDRGHHHATWEEGSSGLVPSSLTAAGAPGLQNCHYSRGIGPQYVLQPQAGTTDEFLPDVPPFQMKTGSRFSKDASSDIIHNLAGRGHAVVPSSSPAGDETRDSKSNATQKDHGTGEAGITNGLQRPVEAVQGPSVEDGDQWQCAPKKRRVCFVDDP